ncbi:MAG: hypothetical protein ACYCO3_08590 [Mycobacteriales bacterium]
MSAELASLLAAGERAAFHGPPVSAVSVLEQAAVLAAEQDRAAEAVAAAWLLGVSLAAAGQVGRALSVLDPLFHDDGVGPEQRLFGALAAATAASAHRQLGRHEAARHLDERALALADTSAEAIFDARLGLACDAIGLGNADAARPYLQAAAGLAGSRHDWWRQRVRLDWGRAELALLEGDASAAVTAASAAVERAEAARAPRHVAKSLLYQGLAELASGQELAATTLRRASTLAEGLAALQLIWRARAVLGALLAESDAEESRRSLATARTAVATMAAELPVALRDEWLARAEIAALLET